MTRIIHPVPLVLAVALAAASAAISLPKFQLFLVGQLAMVVIVTVSMTILMGGAGLLSLASAAFLAVGAYGLLIAMGPLGLPLLPALVVVVACCAALGGVLGVLALRISGFYLAVVTLGFLQVLLTLLKHGGDLTGGGYGLITPLLSFPGVKRLTVAHVSMASVFLAVCVIGVGVALMSSRMGRAWLALRDKEPAARMLGIDVSRMRILVFAFTSGLIGLAGTLHPLLLGVANPGSFSVHLSIFHITLVVVGGMTGSMAGAVTAPALLFFIPEYFSTLGEWRDFFYGGILLAALIFMPNGIAAAVTERFPRLRALSGGVR
ncbi:MAG: hypothetical protein BGP06_05175 [Rhizobiales bacterium 65-9]|nr:branched-chain amino acid ABC transporter permease [Hyphomicrobiales bacterium]OJY35285.1 MAG: hypothetical protein BGP06_05175 [Rhizobiales bacterium 65-9]